LVAYINEVESSEELIDEEHLAQLQKTLNQGISTLSVLRSYMRQLSYNVQPKYEAATPNEKRKEADITEKLLMERIVEMVPGAVAPVPTKPTEPGAGECPKPD
jgi:hypothetical protein